MAFRGLDHGGTARCAQAGFGSRLLVAGVIAALGLSGCTHPIGADRTTVRQAHKQLTASAISGKCSDTTRLVLHRYDLVKLYRKEPAIALQRLHKQALIDTRRDIIYALAELNYERGERLKRSVKPGEPQKAADFYLASAIYAWIYLLGEASEPPPNAFDWRFRVACDLYNRAVALGFSEAQSSGVVRLREGTRTLGPGAVEVAFTQPAFKWNLDDIDRFLPADEYKVRGFTVRDRQSGLGAPLIAVGKTSDPKRFSRYIPATALLRVEGNLQDWSERKLGITLELYSSYQVESVEVGGKTIPLESDVTAPLAYSLNDSFVWKLGSAQFFSADERIRNGIYFTQPYEPGRIPVLFVHGTFSSPIWWGEMWNTLRADPVLRQKYQFWNFIYNSGNPVPVSANKLRDEIDRKIKQLDPEGKDPALRQMVIIGHSQGGLLTRLTVTDTGEELWHAVSREDMEDLGLSPKELEQLRRLMCFTSLPSVKRVVFVSTPHRGSYMATSFVRSLAAKFMRMPSQLVDASTKLLSFQNPLDLKPGYEKRVPTSLDSMSPNNPWLLALSELPVESSVKAHSIVALKGKTEPPQGGDGVVKYTSAHLTGMESEFVVRSGHSCQDKPSVIEEVRRILLEHVEESAEQTRNHP